MGRGGRIKKLTKRPLTNLPACKHSRFQELLKSSWKAKKKKAVTDTQISCSVESDPITSCGEEMTATHLISVGDIDGIGLEVILPQPSGDEADPVGSVGAEISGGACGGRALGLVDLVGDSMPIGINLTTTGGMVDKDRGDAYHIIDIQEDVGLNFVGEEDDTVNRIVRYETRDRKLKSDWVHNNGYQ
jgi:hypothetical protein